MLINIYLDIDGVLLVNDKNVAPFAEEFLQHILKKYHGNVYWLTAHNLQGVDRAKAKLEPHLKLETVKLLDKVKLSEWKELKTDAINFEQDFLWFDDDLWPDELKVLEKNNATGNFVMVDLAKDPEMLKSLISVL